MDKLDCIDNLDKRILQIVMHNARIPSKDVALVCGVSRAAIHQRIQRMIELGIITGSGYNVNTQLLGYSTCTYIGVNLERAALYSTLCKNLKRYRKSPNAISQPAPTPCSSNCMPKTTST